MRYDLPALARGNGIRRKAVTLRPVEPTLALIGDLYAIAREMIDGASQVALGRLLDVYAPRPVMTHDDTASTIGDALAAVGETIRRLSIAINPQVRRWAVKVEEWQRRTFATTVKSGTGADVVAYLHAEGAEDRVAAATEWAAGLIRSIGDDMRKQIESLTWAGFANQTPRKDIAKQIQTVIGSNKTRATIIARDQTTKLAAQLDQFRQQEAGITQYKWRHSGKKHFRPVHKAREGQIFDWSNPPDDGHPGAAINCFPSWQPVWAHDEILRLWRRWHNGEATKIITATGETIDCTPNHPVLTQAGWKAAETVEVGDNVIEVALRGLDIGSLYVKERQPLIGDIFEAAQILVGSINRNGRSGDFHGDALADEKIEVVNTDIGLRRYLIPTLYQSGVQFSFEKPLMTDAAFEAFCSTLQIRHGFLPPSDSVVRSLRACEALLWRAALCRDEVGRARAAEIDAMAFEHFGQRLSRHAEAVADRFDAFARHVGETGLRLIVLASITGRAVDGFGREAAPHFQVLGERVAAETAEPSRIAQHHASLNLRNHRVERVITRAWEGHVYNLETESGWYHAGFAAVRNCGCKAQAYVNLDD